MTKVFCFFFSKKKAFLACLKEASKKEAKTFY